MLYPEIYGQNPMFPKSTDFKVIHKDDKSGSGVICFRSFKQGEVIAHMTGEVINEIRQHTLQISSDRHLYDPHFSGYFLHSCAPNISLDMENMTVTALKAIPKNSYLYMDYAETEDILFKQFPCSCGASECRGWITGKKEMLPVMSSNNRYVAKS
ncbi:MAG: SET domain-containing protein-lysine N-methyltransferase [Gammaproteobacteria bacterium]|nr:SET domain-containing protein-lysine N-methyltransferase [Gammaproteobacteria bacterium]MCW8987961.1 SET domain-containing protein-lysine N-methyltransferase [Gammaproteobacteria bacterium]